MFIVLSHVRGTVKALTKDCNLFRGYHFFNDFSVFCQRERRISMSGRTLYRVARKICGSFILRIGDFLLFAGTNFCDLSNRTFKWKKPLIFSTFIVRYVDSQLTRLTY